MFVLGSCDLGNVALAHYAPLVHKSSFLLSNGLTACGHARCARSTGLATATSRSSIGELHRSGEAMFREERSSKAVETES